jgi:hypothetical protein
MDIEIMLLCKKLRQEKGQSLVEYIMVLSLVVFIFSMIMTSPFMKNIFGPQANFLNWLQKRATYHFRFGDFPENRQFEHSSNYQNHHPLYMYSQGGSRFFTHAEPYPKE